MGTPHFRVLSWLPVLLAAACNPTGDSTTTTSSSSGTGCPLPYAGDPSQPPEMELWALGAQAMTAALVDGGPLPLVFPPQGGRVALVGVRARNINPCAVQLSGAVRDLVNDQVRVDARTVNLRVSDAGYAFSADTNINQWANIPLCPNQWASGAVENTTFRVELTLTERNGREMRRDMLVVPYCAEPENLAECRCICREDYVLGQSCEDADGGVSDAGHGGSGSSASGAVSGAGSQAGSQGSTDGGA